MAKRPIRKRRQTRAAATPDANHSGSSTAAAEKLDAFITTATEALEEMKAASSGATDAAESATAAAERAEKAAGENAARIQLVEDSRASSQDDAPDVEKRFKKILADGQRDFKREIQERFDRQAAKNNRPALDADRPEGFRSAIATSEDFKAWLERDKRNEDVSFRVPVLEPHRRAATVIGTSYLADLSQDALKPEIVRLLQEPIGLIDVINEVPPVNADTYKFLKITDKSDAAGISNVCTTAVDGAPTPKTDLPMTDTTGFFAGQFVLIHHALGTLGPLAIESVDPGVKLVFATDALTVDIAVGDDITAEDYVGTTEAATKPGALLEGAEVTENFVQLAAYIVLTRQRLRRTNVLDLAAFAEDELKRRHRRALEWNLINGSGTAPQLEGFLNATGLATDVWSTAVAVGDTRADLLLWSACQINSDRQITAVMHRKDWWRINNGKATDGHYINTPLGPAQIVDTPALKMIGALRVIVTNKIAQGTALVADLEAVSDFVRGGDAEFSVGWINDQMIKNLVTMLYEEAVVHAIKDITAIRKASFDAAPS